MASDLRGELESSLGVSYTIERELGGGGMSRVFVASERALGRRVVIKVLSPELAAEVSTRRFEREIKLAASLQQANIVPVLAAGDTGGTPFYVMPFVEGLSLRARLDRDEPLSPAEKISILRDIARALAYAHERGVVHRDIKPENVLLSGDAAVVTDFGIAKAIDQSRRGADGTPRPDTQGSITQIGTAVGTPVYMAPEQAAGDPRTDHRADLYAFGCVAYELFAGHPPFMAASLHALFAAHLSEPPVPLDEKAPTASPAVVALVMRCLEKDPARRPQSAREILAELEQATTGDTALWPFRRLRRRQRRIAIGAAVVALSTAAAWLLIRAVIDRPAPSVAVIPFFNVSGDSAEEYLADGMADGLTTALGKVPGIRVASRSLGYRYRGRRAVDVSDVGRTLAVDHVVHGAVHRVGNRLRVSAQLVSASDNRELWSETYERRATDAFTVQDEITRQIAAELRGHLAAAEATPPVPTQNAEAYDLYLRGRFLLLRRGTGVRRAAENFEAAIARDSNFALAHASLALALELLPYFEPVNARILGLRAVAAAERALALDSTIAEAHTALAMAHQHLYEWDQAEESYRRALRYGPDEPDAQIQFGRFLWYTGRGREAMPYFERARTLDPHSAVASGWHGHMLFLTGRRDEGLREMRRAVEIDSTNPPALTFLMGALAKEGQVSEARAMAERLWRTVPTWRDPAAAVLARTGDTTRSVELLRQWERRRGVNPFANTMLATQYSALRDSVRMFEALERATANGEIWPTYYSLSEERFDFVRQSARFAAIVRGVGLSVPVFTSPTGGRPQ